MTLTTPTWGTVCCHKTNILGPTRAQNLTILSSAIPEKFKGCKILKWMTSSVIQRLTLDIACKHTKFDDSSLRHSRDISGGLRFLNASHGPDHAHLGDSWSSVGQYLSWPNRAQHLKSVAPSRSEGISWGVKF